jgi:hypothetical protein
VSKDSLIEQPILNINTDTKWVSTQLNSPYFLFQNAAGTGVQQEEQKIQQILVNWQAMQISYINVLKSLMALRNYISQVRNMLPIFIHAY